MSPSHGPRAQAYSRDVRETWVNLAGAIAVAVALAVVLWVVMHLALGW